jgi:hypothetical protein
MLRFGLHGPPSLQAGIYDAQRTMSNESVKIQPVNYVLSIATFQMDTFTAENNYITACSIPRSSNINKDPHCFFAIITDISRARKKHALFSVCMNHKARLALPIIKQ